MMTSLPPRPSTALQGLAISGAPPPSRQGRPATAPRTAPRPEAQLSLLAVAFIKKLRAKFGDAAADVQSQEIITQEVLAFMSKAARTRIREEDVATVQERVRARLTGRLEVKNTLAAEIRARVAADEWSKMFAYNIAEGQAKDRRQVEALCSRQQELRGVLDTQRAELAARKKLQAEALQEEHQAEQASFKAWEAEEEDKRVLQAAIMARLKAERQVQLNDRDVRKGLAQEQRREEEDALASKIAFETRTEFEREEARRQAARAALKESMVQNENNKVVKHQAKIRAWEEDQVYKLQWEAILDKQERERTSRLERLKVLQSKQEDVAKSTPESKRWLDPAIIERQYKEREEAREADEKARAFKVKDTARKLVASLGEQVAEKEAAKEAHRKSEAEKAKQLFARIAAQEAAEVAAKAAVTAAKLKIRAELEVQMRENALRKRISPMSTAEKLINANLLKHVYTYQATGKVAVA
ncbi:MAG: hypothetical protein WDW38_007630 [Sanguina aurantia]